MKKLKKKKVELFVENIGPALISKSVYKQLVRAAKRENKSIGLMAYEIIKKHYSERINLEGEQSCDSTSPL